jgi:2-dehydropantoate 2-reductase
MTEIALIGPGAIGATIAVHLAQAARNAITVCARSPVARLTVEAAQGTRTIVPNTLAAPGDGTPVEWILVATKAYDAAAAARWLPGLTGPATRLAVLQNGVEHVARFAPWFPAERIVPVIVDIPVERIAPGHFRQRRSGLLTVADDADGRDFAALFADTGMPVTLSPDLRSAAWRKLAVNCAGAISALVLQPSAIARRPAIADIMLALVRECIAVGRAEGAELDDGLAASVVDGYRASPPDSINSLHADRLAGRAMEIDARNGVIVRLGSKHGIDTPVNRMIVALLQAAAGQPE